MDIYKFFKKQYKVKRLSLSKNSIGSASEELEEVGNIKGIINPVSGNLSKVNSRINSETTHMLYCGLTSIKENDRVFCDEEQYRVIFVNNPMNFDEFLQVELQVVT